MKTLKGRNIIFGKTPNLAGFSHVVLIYDKSLTKYRDEIIAHAKVKKEKLTLIPLKAIETSKSLDQAHRIFNLLSRSQVDRKSIIVGLGGGVIGDIAGFVASTYLRGIAYLAIPTTILSQVDSSIGGKNGVNLAAGKNLVGTIYQPTLTVINSNLLATLPEREMISGLGEILKYSLLTKTIAFPLFKETSAGEISNKLMFLKAVKKLTPLCVKYKMSLVAKDEFDSLGIRQQLNLGHTLAHVLETLTNYKKYKHGEAVIWGLKFACIVSYIKGHLGFTDFRSIMNLANRLRIPSLPANLNAKKCYELALRDKKSHNQDVNMVLLKGPYKVMTNQSVTKEEFIEAIALLKDFS